MARYYVMSGDEVIGEVEASSAFTAACGEICERAPEDAVLVDLATGNVVAWRSCVAQFAIWNFVDEWCEPASEREERGAA